MADNFNFEFVSPERLLISEKVSEVVIPATEGEMTVMAHHAPTMTVIKPGVVTVKFASGKTGKYVIFGGFADITPERLTLLAESAVPVDELSRDTLMKRIELAKAELDDTENHEHRTKLEQFLNAMTHLNGILVPA
ncbi:F0F1 ATP synthase subunit epsilon [Agrobacterium vitis]|uniref:ATP synthase epsilon chain n=1 Tax=Agrobacterium vitis TaxID=373 RepID=A0ABD6GCN3_AGRVI|nr:F0F1 ATP synthase subunit epsilon [Agrobacterium vitis]MUO79554.1 F0F1 ATP synthase subunit epsilon [Agrobacterium vitis]MUO95923.1 F0F1 ATP synthase subunit epsilon [Agrobacterium vitis]MUP06681.1 F0F1 ATP synthase subunit epsilon [Agrobacterium vitis]MUZ83482.1 F0F1 ATP synthase subunit epsilon [Agrobacterium vitis]MVA12026.1 F0F1 ATP synthase subunit epsilon [Agrobacterium vitis]